MAAIIAENLVRRFDAFTAVDGISFTVQPGEIFGFLGPNGSGKTVTIKMLCGILPLTGGAAQVDGIDVVRDPDSVRARIGYMSQKFALYDDLTVRENLRFYGMVYDIRGAALARRMEEIIARIHLEPFLGRQAGKLSGGWKQRLALGCALLHEPHILFLDEPTAGIDPVARRQLWDLLFEFSGHGMTFFVTTHYMDEAERCSHLAYIYYGRLIADGTPLSLRQLPDMTPAGTYRLEITTSEVTVALRRVRALPAVRSATIFGRSIHALIDATCPQQELARAIGDDGIRIEDLRPLAPSLEDVFVELSERRQRELAA
ncbi:MAG: ABC transporter ATP-binding protein [Gammaproteobacteria bacterium]|nr:ABC transporter ATP-binding protein [Gammaproteobacteria bacterium]